MKAITFFKEDREPKPNEPNEILSFVVEDEIANYIYRLEQKTNQKDNIINKLEEFFQYEFDNEVRPLNDRKISVWTICLDKLKELKEGNK